MPNHNIDPKVEEILGPVIIGPPNHEHFILQLNELICVRNTNGQVQDKCVGCALKQQGCEIAPAQLERNILPSARRGVGLEPRPFIVLKPKSQNWFSEIQSDEACKIKHFDYADLSEDPSNNHYLLNDFDSQTLQVIKGQHRFYGSRAELDESGLLSHYDIWDIYVPLHIYHSLDFSAIEPRVATILSKEPLWVEVFNGVPKVAFRQISFKEKPEALPTYTLVHQNQLGQTEYYCHLKGEMDKSDYETQCSKCPIREVCVPIHDQFMNVPGDFHGINTRALYPQETQSLNLSSTEDKATWKALRDIGKIVGLALCVGPDNLISVKLRSKRSEEEIHVDLSIQQLSELIPDKSFEYWAETKFGFREIYDVFETSPKEAIYVRTENGESITLSLEHRVDLGDCVCQAGALSLTDRIQTRYGLSPISEIKRLGRSRMFELTLDALEHERLFFANGISIHNCYGGSAYTVAVNMRSTKEAAQKNIDNFFSLLTGVKTWMQNQKRQILSTGSISNAFGRIRSMAHEAFSKDRKLMGYAERTSYNHPMQSTASELLKIAQIRLNTWADSKQLSYLSGQNTLLDINKPDGSRINYRDFKYIPLMSVHDETDNLIREDLTEELYPEAYTVCQIEDVSKALGVKFKFEMDLEFDPHRSWTASRQYDRARIYLHHFLRSSRESTKSGGRSQGSSLAIVSIEDLSKLHLEAIAVLAEANKDFQDLENMIYLGVKAQGKTYVHESKFTRQQIDHLKIQYTLSTYIV